MESLILSRRRVVRVRRGSKQLSSKLPIRVWVLSFIVVARDGNAKRMILTEAFAMCNAMALAWRRISTRSRLNSPG